MNNDGLVYHKQINSYLILFDRLFFSFVKTISAHIFDNPSFIVLQIYKNIFKKKNAVAQCSRRNQGSVSSTFPCASLLVAPLVYTIIYNQLKSAILKVIT